MILAGDIGGTKTRLAFFNDKLEMVAGKIYRSREFPGLGSVLDRFAGETGLRPERAAFGIAGPVRDGVCKATNLPWVVDAREVAGRMGLPAVDLINDLEANAYGIALLQPQDFAVINQGDRNFRGNQAVISAGTGLGQAGLFWDGREHRPFACEGGHSGFAPRNDRELDLSRYLLERFGYAEGELLISGSGLKNIYDFLRDTARAAADPRLEGEMCGRDPAPCISGAALDGSSPICVQALDLFVELYGAEAANLGFKVMATGGIFLGGGIAPKILPKLQSGRFLKAFLGRGPLRAVLETMPVHVIRNDQTALLGAARYATEMEGHHELASCYAEPPHHPAGTQASRGPGTALDPADPSRLRRQDTSA